MTATTCGPTADPATPALPPERQSSERQSSTHAYPAGPVTGADRVRPHIPPRPALARQSILAGAR